MSKLNHHHKIVIVGGGTGGICVAARLARAGLAQDIAIIEPNDAHYYQPLWTLVAAGVVDMDTSKKLTKDFIPKGVRWYQDFADVISAEHKSLKLRGGSELTFDWLVLAPGIELDWGTIKGGKEALAAPNVSCIYDRDYVVKTKAALEKVSSGRLIFSFPPPPVKCAGAPQKIMYLADEILRKSGKRNLFEIQYRSALGGIFGIPLFADVLNKVIERKEIKTFFNQRLVEVRSKENQAVFAHADGTTEVVPYEYLHLVPTMRPPAVIRESDVAESEGANRGWIDVDPFTLQHRRWPWVYGIGDACATPNAKTGAAIRKQAPVLVGHLLAAMSGRRCDLRYNGYASCPLVTGFGKVVLAEFGYDGKLLPSFPGNPARESRLMWWLKTLVLPRLYWYLMLRGLA